MNLFSQKDIVVLFLSIALMLGAGRLFGELFRRFKLPPVVGEIMAGIVIGPSLLGSVFPDIYSWLYPAGTRGAVALESFVLMGVVFLLLTAGLEVDLSSVWKQGKSVFVMSVFSIAIPFLLGFFLPLAAGSIFNTRGDTLLLSLFLGVALSITALPVIAKILLDMNLFKSDFGMLVMASAMLCDLFGWLIFSVIIQFTDTGGINPLIMAKTVGFTVALAAVILTVLRYVISHLFPWVQAGTEWPGGVIVFIVVIGLIFSALTEAIGIHAIFGAFLAGIALGDSPHLREHTKEIIHQFINNIFAPLFFVSIGLRIDFIGNFNPAITITLIVLAIAGKMGGAVIGGRLSGLTLRETLPVGAAMSTIGVMGIIIGLFALQKKVIDQETYVSIVIMALTTSLFSSPLIKMFLKPRNVLALGDLLENRVYVSPLEASDVRHAVMELSRVAGSVTGVRESIIAARVLERETIMHTGIGNNIAVPHARMAQISRPWVIVGKSPAGVDFDAFDGKPAHLIFLILTPIDDQEAQIQILAQIARIFSSPAAKELAMNAKNFIEFMSAVKSSGAPGS